MWPFELLHLTDQSKPSGRFQRCRMRKVIDKAPVAKFFAQVGTADVSAKHEIVSVLYPRMAKITLSHTAPPAVPISRYLRTSAV